MCFTEQHLFFDDLEIGQAWTSPGRTITEGDIVNFAGISGDFNPIHVDHHFARNTIFRRPIAHGLLVWSVSSGLSVGYPQVRTIAFTQVKDWQFKEPVFIGDTIRCVTRVAEIDVRSRGRRAAISWHRTILNQEDKVVQEGTVVTLVEGRAAVAKERIHVVHRNGDS
jgi:acyl dehydratase